MALTNPFIALRQLDEQITKRTEIIASLAKTLHTLGANATDETIQASVVELKGHLSVLNELARDRSGTHKTVFTSIVWRDVLQ
jgi:hypothetical protein